MRALEVDRWATALWNHFRPKIASGAPFYLAADRHLMGELYREALSGVGGPDAALVAFHKACLSLFRRRGTSKVSVQAAAFEAVPGAVGSRVVCLAVQQVLIVEQMLKDEEFSENSYFPRYRDVLGLVGGEERSNPLLGSAFQAIWAVLARELRTIDGASDRTVTFSAGTGVDLNRNLPLSQALLTTHDLTIIKEEAPFLDGASDSRRIFNGLRQARASLGSRAKGLIATANYDGLLASRLADQVRSFLLDADVFSDLRPREGVVADAGEVVAYLERPDLFAAEGAADTLAVYWRVDNEQWKDGRLIAALERKLSSRVFLLLVSEGDAFREFRKAEQMRPGEAVVAIVTRQSVGSFVEKARTRYGAVFAPAISNVASAYQALISSAGGAGLSKALLARSEDARAERGIQLEGGLLVDARSQVFLAGYPPAGVWHNGQRLGSESAIDVNGTGRFVGEFLEELREERQVGRYEIRCGAESIEFTVAGKRVVPRDEEEAGYAITAGEFDLVPGPLDRTDAALRGTWLKEATRQRPFVLSERDLLLLIGRGKRLAVPGVVLAFLLDELQLRAEADPRARLAARQLAVTKSVPLKLATSGLLRRLQAAGDGARSGGGEVPGNRW